jgi:hypothetical protein
MPNKIKVLQSDLDAVLDWMAELDTASSYDGFTYAKWTLGRPVDAIKRLRGHKSGD